MKRQWMILPITMLAIVNDGEARCIAEPTISSEVLVQGCLAVTFAAPDSPTPTGANDRTASPYKTGATYSGTYLIVLVNKSTVVPLGNEPIDNSQAWTQGGRKGLFVHELAGDVCPKALNGVITVMTGSFCCDRYPWQESCLVPSTVQRVTIAAPAIAD
jgi:hypothetical protein